MRNLKKLLAVVLTVVMIASMMVPALAANTYEEEALKLQSIGMFAGDPADLKLEEGVTRIQGLAFAIRAAGKEADAFAMTDEEVTTILADWTDAATIPAWGLKYAAYAIKNGITVGTSATQKIFGALDPISGTSFLVFLMKSGMGYADVTTATVVEASVTAGILTAGQAAAFGAKTALIRDDAAGILFGAAMNGVNADGTKLIDALIASGFVDADDALEAGFVDEVEPEDLEVLSVEALNLAQLEITLSNDNYDEDEVKNKSNYDFEGVRGDRDEELDIIDISVDGTSVVLTLGDDQDTNDTADDVVLAVDNQTKATLTIDEAAFGDELEFEDIEFDDFDLPTIEEVKVIGEDTVKVIFSEPMFNLAGMEDEFDFELDGKSYSVDDVTAVNKGIEANVSVYGKFTEGTLTVEVGNGIEDYAGFAVKAQEFEVDVVVDEDAPVVIDYKDADTDEVTLIFDEDIRFTSATVDLTDFYHSNRNTTALSATIDGDELTLRFDEDDELPTGTAYIYIKSGAVEDFWNNENDSIKVKVEIVEDEDAPEVKKIEMDAAAQTIEITFNENLDEDSAEDVDNYVLINEDDDEISIRSAVYADDDDEGIVTLNLRAVPDDGIYELTISDVEDRAGNEMDEYSEEIEVADSAAPTTANTNVYVDGLSAAALADTENDTKWDIYVEYNEPMAVSGSYSIKDLYKYEITDGDNLYNLGEAEEDDDFDVTIKISNNDKLAKITINGLEYDGNMSLTIARVADAAGNRTALTLGAFPLNDDIATATGILIEEAVAKAKDKIEVKFDGNLDDYEVNDFAVYNGTAIAANKLEIDDIDIVDGDEVIFWMDDKLPTDTSNVIIVTASTGIGTENSFGIKLEAGITFSNVEDEIAPEVIADDKDIVNVGANFDTATYTATGNSDDDIQRVYATYTSPDSIIYIEFSEEISPVSANLITVTAGQDALDISGVALGDSDGLTNNVLIITVDGEVIKGDDIDITLVSDLDGNSIRDLALDIEYVVDGTAY